MEEITKDEFIEYITSKKTYFINRLGGSDYKAYILYQNEKVDLNYLIKYLSIWNGYYDNSQDKNIRFKNISRFFEELIKIYKNNTLSYNACNFIKYNPQFEKENNLKFISYHDINEGHYFFKKVLLKKYFKKILIISPFTKLIKSQIPKLNKLYNENNIELEFIFLNTYITYYNEDNNTYIDAPHGNFFETLQEYQTKINNIDFDIALLSCGTYAHFIGEHIKSINKKAFYVGGILPLWFGIYGDVYIKNPHANWFNNYKNCIFNKHTIEHSKKTLESLNSYLYNEYKYEEIIKTFDYKNYEALDYSYEEALLYHICKTFFKKNVI